MGGNFLSSPQYKDMFPEKYSIKNALLTTGYKY